MENEALCLRAERIDNNIFEIFSEKELIFTVYVDNCENPSWIHAVCDECNQKARGFSAAINIAIAKVIDATETVIKVEDSLLAQIREIIMNCCSELYHSFFVCDECADKERQKLAGNLAV
jgi:hypothetical protein